MIVNDKNKHNATRSFQALRIFVNKEITELINGIIYATKLLRPGGKILIVSFHSIEDKVVKYFFTNYAKNKSKPSRYLPEESLNNSHLFENYNKKIINLLIYNEFLQTVKIDLLKNNGNE